MLNYQRVSIPAVGIYCHILIHSGSLLYILSSWLAHILSGHVQLKDSLCKMRMCEAVPSPPILLVVNLLVYDPLRLKRWSIKGLAKIKMGDFRYNTVSFLGSTILSRSQPCWRQPLMSPPRPFRVKAISRPVWMPRSRPLVRHGCGGSSDLVVLMDRG